MIFTKGASNNDKGQSRSSFRSRMSSVGAALKPKRHSQLQSPIVPSAPHSECSTLVEFAIEDVRRNEEEDELDFDTDEYMLDPENSAWTTPGKYMRTASLRQIKQKGTRAPQQIVLPETEGLSLENSSWGGTRPLATRRVKTRPRFLSSGRPASKFGIEPEYLDSEDRAWM